MSGYNLTSIEKFNVLRPLLKNHMLGSYEMPVMNRVYTEQLDIETLMPINCQNLNCRNNNSNKIALFFSYDKVLQRYWSQPLKYIPLLQTCRAASTPDFSVRSAMNRNMIRMAVFQNRWLGCIWSDCGILTVPTIGWDDLDTYDICFSGISRYSVVVVSTIGCKNNSEKFLQGFNALKETIEPELIIVYGDIIKGMFGTFLNFKYKESFSRRKNMYEQIPLLLTSKITCIKEGEIIGI
ncbi:MAG: DUF4417 domain-containing protein [Phascolarctobacterium sp.]|nr:DUF4417 domain-containing protein [Phascolarctobacterium sp.]